MNERTEREREKEFGSISIKLWRIGTGLAKVVTEKMQTPTTKLD